MKKTLTTVLALILVLAVSGIASYAEFALPIVEEPVTLTVFMKTDVKWSATKNSVAEVGSYQTVMNKTGVNIEFIHPAVGQDGEQFNLIVASTNRPDMIVYNWANVSGGPAKYINDGVILPLNEYMEQWAPNFLAYMERYPDVRKQSVLDDGTYYMFPMLRIDEETGAGTWFKTSGFMIRQDWLDALDLEMPTTKDELYEVYTAFRNEDPNGNGEMDEIPYVCEKGTGLAPFAGMFGVLDDFYVDNGEVKYGPIQDNYYEYLSTMRQWYEENLIDPEYAMTDVSTLTNKITNNIGGSTNYSLAGGMGTWTNMMGMENLHLEAMPWPSMEKGELGYTTLSEYNKVVTGYGCAITKACEERGNLEIAVRFRDYFYCPEGVIDTNFGILGESYTMVDGEPIFTDAVLNNDKGLTTTQALSQYALSASDDAMVKTDMYFKQVSLLLDNQRRTQPVWNHSDNTLLLPNIAHTAEESAFVAEKMNEINTYKNEMVMKFVLGQVSLDEFESYVKYIENLGIEEVIACKQAAYERYSNR